MLTLQVLPDHFTVRILHALYDASNLFEHPEGTVLNYFMKKKNRCDIHIREMLMTYQHDPDVNRCIDKSVYSPFLQLK